MGHPRLTDAERLERKKARSAHSFSDAAYSHYDPQSQGYGSAEEWVRAAEALSGNRASLKSSKAKSLHQEDLEALMLDRLPADIAGLKKAFRNALFVVHPDHGGTTEATVATLAAFERLSKLY